MKNLVLSLIFPVLWTPSTEDPLRDRIIILRENFANPEKGTGYEMQWQFTARGEWSSYCLYSNGMIAKLGEGLLDEKKYKILQIYVESKMPSAEASLLNTRWGDAETVHMVQVRYGDHVATYFDDSTRLGKSFWGGVADYYKRNPRKDTPYVWSDSPPYEVQRLAQAADEILRAIKEDEDD